MRDESAKVTVYALNVQSLAYGWARAELCPKNFRDADQNNLIEYCQQFATDTRAFFENEYPVATLKFIRSPASWNQRMRKQLGCFLYDTVHSGKLRNEESDFEAFVSGIVEQASSLPGPKPMDPRIIVPGDPTLTKFVLPFSWVSEVFGRLEMMNITATNLLDHEGLSADVRNSYYYHRKSRVWDLDVF